MYKVIDFRLRPPFKSFATTAFFTNYNSESNKADRAKKGNHTSPAAEQCSMELMIQEMDANNVVKGVAIARESNWGGAAHNSDLPEMLAAYPNRFIGVPHIQYGSEQDPLEVIEKYVIQGPCSGIYIEPSFRFEKYKLHANDEKFYPIYEKCSAYKIPVILQYGGGANSIKYYDPSDIYQIAEDFPDINIAISHGGWPQVIPMLQQAFAHKNVYISPDCYIAGFPGSSEYVVAANGILEDKIIFGSAYPGLSLEDAIGMYLNSGIKEEILPKVLYENAARFFELQ